MKLLILAIIVFALLGNAQGASVASAVSGGNCTKADDNLAVSCSDQMYGFFGEVLGLDIKQIAEMEKYKRSCDALDHCFNMIEHCKGFAIKTTDEIFTTIKALCGFAHYFGNEFVECKDKIEAKNSTCFNNWNGVHNAVALKDVEERCKNIFGKDQCIKTEIIELCGQKKWEGFRDHSKAVNDFWPKCDLDKIY